MVAASERKRSGIQSLSRNSKGLVWRRKRKKKGPIRGERKGREMSAANHLMFWKSRKGGKGTAFLANRMKEGRERGKETLS